MLSGLDQTNPYKNGMSGFKRFLQRTHRMNHSNTASVTKPLALRLLTPALPIVRALHQPHEELRAMTV